MKNYTSTVSVLKSILHIETVLIKNGALNISKTYDGFGAIESIYFQLDCSGTPYSFRLPANVNACKEALKKIKENGGLTRTPTSRIKDQAERTAWKIISDWVDIQLALIEMEQAEFLEIFLPYVSDGNTTFYQKLKTEQFKLLPKV